MYTHRKHAKLSKKETLNTVAPFPFKVTWRVPSSHEEWYQQQNEPLGFTVTHTVSMALFPDLPRGQGKWLKETSKGIRGKPVLGGVSYSRSR